MSFDVQKIRRHFPMLQQKVHGNPLVYLDNAATALKPAPVIAAIADYYSSYCSNVHRGLHQMSQRATTQYEGARTVVQKWINAPEAESIVFTSGTTAAINLLAHSYGWMLKAGDEIVVSIQEHHSNIVPWQLLQKRKQIALKVLPIDDQGRLQWQQLPKLLSEKTKIVSLSHVSNTLGVINPIAEITALVKKHCDAVVVVDGAQAAAHLAIDVQQLGVDFYCFSSHKLFGPTGLGILFGKKSLLDSMPPFMGGGDMVDEVDFAGTTFAGIPQKFEAGTPHIAGAIGLAAAIEYLQGLGGMEGITRYEEQLNTYAMEKLQEINGPRLLGGANPRVPLFTFVLEGVHAQDLAMVLDQQGIAVRTGHHCTWPLLKRFGVDSTTRASLAMYNTTDEIDQLAHALNKAKELLS